MGSPQAVLDAETINRVRDIARAQMQSRNLPHLLATYTISELLAHAWLCGAVDILQAQVRRAHE